MDRSTFLGILAAALLAGSPTVANAQQQRPSSQQMPPSATDSSAMGADLLTASERQRFDDMRKNAKGRAELDRVEAQERALLNERVLERTMAQQRQGAPMSPSTAEQPPSAAPSMAPSPAPDPGMGR